MNKLGVDRDTIEDYNVRFNRHDPRLVQVVEQLGEQANGPFCELEVVDVGSAKRYFIEEYDGIENIVLENNIAWNVID